MIDEVLLGGNRAVRHARRVPLQMPVLYLFADGDGALTLNLLRDVGSVAPDIDLRIMPNCSHWVQQELPEQVNALLRQFVEK